MNESVGLANDADGKVGHESGSDDAWRCSSKEKESIRVMMAAE